MKLNNDENIQMLWELLSSSSNYLDITKYASPEYLQTQFHQKVSSIDQQYSHESILQLNKRVLAEMFDVFQHIAHVNKPHDAHLDFQKQTPPSIDFTTMQPINSNIPSPAAEVPLDQLLEQKNNERNQHPREIDLKHLSEKLQAIANDLNHVMTYVSQHL